MLRSGAVEESTPVDEPGIDDLDFDGGLSIWAVRPVAPAAGGVDSGLRAWAAPEPRPGAGPAAGSRRAGAHARPEPPVDTDEPVDRDGAGGPGAAGVAGRPSPEPAGPSVEAGADHHTVASPAPDGEERSTEVEAGLEGAGSDDDPTGTGTGNDATTRPAADDRAGNDVVAGPTAAAAPDQAGTDLTAGRTPNGDDRTGPGTDLTAGRAANGEDRTGPRGDVTARRAVNGEDRTGPGTDLTARRATDDQHDQHDPDGTGPGNDLTAGPTDSTDGTAPGNEAGPIDDNTDGTGSGNDVTAGPADSTDGAALENETGPPTDDPDGTGSRSDIQAGPTAGSADGTGPGNGVATGPVGGGSDELDEVPPAAAFAGWVVVDPDDEDDPARSVRPLVPGRRAYAESPAGRVTRAVTELADLVRPTQPARLREPGRLTGPTGVAAPPPRAHTNGTNGTNGTKTNGAGRPAAGDGARATDRSGRGLPGLDSLARALTSASAPKTPAPEDPAAGTADDRLPGGASSNGTTPTSQNAGDPNSVGVNETAPADKPGDDPAAVGRGEAGLRRPSEPARLARVDEGFNREQGYAGASAGSSGVPIADGPGWYGDDAGWHGDTVSAEPRSLSLVPPYTETARGRPEGDDLMPAPADPWNEEDPFAGVDLSGAAMFARPAPAAPEPEGPEHARAEHARPAVAADEFPVPTARAETAWAEPAWTGPAARPAPAPTDRPGPARTEQTPTGRTGPAWTGPAPADSTSQTPTDRTDPARTGPAPADSTSQTPATDRPGPAWTGPAPADGPGRAPTDRPGPDWMEPAEADRPGTGWTGQTAAVDRSGPAWSGPAADRPGPGWGEGSGERPEAAWTGTNPDRAGAAWTGAASADERGTAAWTEQDGTRTEWEPSWTLPGAGRPRTGEARTEEAWTEAARTEQDGTRTAPESAWSESEPPWTGLSDTQTIRLEAARAAQVAARQAATPWPDAFGAGDRAKAAPMATGPDTRADRFGPEATTPGITAPGFTDPDPTNPRLAPAPDGSPTPPPGPTAPTGTAAPAGTTAGTTAPPAAAPPPGPTTPPATTGPSAATPFGATAPFETAAAGAVPFGTGSGDAAAWGGTAYEWTPEPVAGASAAGDGVAVFPIQPASPTPAPPSVPLDEPAAAVIARQVEAARRHLQAALVVANGPAAPQRLGGLLTAIEQALTGTTDLAREMRGVLDAGLADRTFPGEARFLCSPPWESTPLVGRDAYGDDVATPAGLAKLLRALGYEAHSVTSAAGAAGVQLRAERYSMQIALVEPAAGGRQRWSGALEWLDESGTSRTWAETLGPVEMEDEELARRVDELLRRSVQ